MAQTDREALVALYGATGGADWTSNENWITVDDLSQWHGVEINDDGRVVKLQLFSNNLRRPIPEAIGTLSELRLLLLDENILTGFIPETLGDLTNLEGLYVSNNKLKGTIPKELGNVAALVTLWLLRNRLEGPIPPELGNLENLQELCLSQNQLTELGDLAALVVLLLDSNELEGSIPPELVNLGILYQCNLSSNRLKGIIPKELVARLGPMLQVHGNQLTVDWDKSPATDGGGWQNRLEPYNKISIIATLLAGFGLAIFPLPRSDVPEGHDFLLGLTGHVVYNFLMCCSFSTNVLVTIMMNVALLTHTVEVRLVTGMTPLS